MFYGPVLFDYHPVEPEPPAVQLEEVGEGLKRFVRGEFGEAAAPDQPYPGRPDCRDCTASGDEPFEYLAQCERTLVYGGHLETLLAKVPPEVVSQIYAIVCDEKLGHRKNKRHLTEQAFREQVDPLLRDHKRLTFVFPAFPFKDQNPFRTDGPPEHPDLAELALLIRLHTLSLALYQIHPHGADWVLLSDGTAYADIFGIPRHAAEAYQQSLLKWRNRLNFQGTVSIVDLLDLAVRVNGKQLGENPPGQFDVVRAAISVAITELIAGGDEGVRQAMEVLRRGMTWNLNLRPYLATVSPEDMWYVAKGFPREDEPLQVQRVRREIEERAREAALSYASFNLALRHFDAFARYLPSTLRATIHPKVGQLAVPSLGSVFPWNGVGVYSGQGDAATVEVCPVSELRGPHYRSTLPGHAGYFYYRPAV